MQKQQKIMGEVGNGWTGLGSEGIYWIFGIFGRIPELPEKHVYGIYFYIYDTYTAYTRCSIVYGEKGPFGGEKGTFPQSKKGLQLLPQPPNRSVLQVLEILRVE